MLETLGNVRYFTKVQVIAGIEICVFSVRTYWVKIIISRTSRASGRKWSQRQSKSDVLHFELLQLFQIPEEHGFEFRGFMPPYNMLILLYKVIHSIKCANR
jgi:hypothetical protein